MIGKNNFLIGSFNSRGVYSMPYGNFNLLFSPEAKTPHNDGIVTKPIEQ